MTSLAMHTVTEGLFLQCAFFLCAFSLCFFLVLLAVQEEESNNSQKSASTNSFCALLLRQLWLVVLSWMAMHPQRHRVHSRDQSGSKSTCHSLFVKRREERGRKEGFFKCHHVVSRVRRVKDTHWETTPRRPRQLATGTRLSFMSLNNESAGNKKGGIRGRRGRLNQATLIKMNEREERSSMLHLSSTERGRMRRRGRGRRLRDDETKEEEKKKEKNKKKTLRTRPRRRRANAKEQLSFCMCVSRLFTLCGFFSLRSSSFYLAFNLHLLPVKSIRVTWAFLPFTLPLYSLFYLPDSQVTRKDGGCVPRERENFYAEECHTPLFAYFFSPFLKLNSHPCTCFASSSHFGGSAPWILYSLLSFSLSCLDLTHSSHIVFSPDACEFVCGWMFFTSPDVSFTTGQWVQVPLLARVCVCVCVYVFVYVSSDDASLDWVHFAWIPLCRKEGNASFESFRSQRAKNETPGRKGHTHPHPHPHRQERGRILPAAVANVCLKSLFLQLYLAISE